MQWANGADGNFSCSLNTSSLIVELFITLIKTWFILTA